MNLSDYSIEDLSAELRKRRLISASEDELKKELQNRIDERWASAKDIDPIPKKIDVDALLDNRPEISPPIDIQIGQKKTSVFFREITRDMMEKAEAYATGYIVASNKEAGLPYEHINSIECQERLAAEKEIRLIHAICLETKAGPPSPAFNLIWIRSNITHKQQTAIMHKYESWFNRDKPTDVITEQEFDQAVEAIKKNDLTWFWTNCEYSTLINLARTLVSRLGKLQTDSALAT